ncbi:MAG: HAD family hydrolase [Steroidobacteraceae bacterium]|nr:HAD family hydrolase [Steroidobacteraceae bacterium]
MSAADTRRGAPRFELAIFDCDGVLVDSERIANEVFAAKLREFGLDVTLEDMFERFVGHSMAHCMQLVAGLLGRPPPADFLDDLQRRTFDAFRRELEPVEGVVAALDAIAPRLATCVASSGDHDKMRVTLGRTGLWSRFEGRIFSAVDVAHAKPAPDVYLHAARSMGVAPARCVVIEDTPIGVAAGVAAGMTVLGYARHTPASRLLGAGAGDTFLHMSELPDRIG